MKKRIVSYIMVLAIMLGFMSGCRPEELDQVKVRIPLDPAEVPRKRN